jgi:hydrogenase expression/formation protein HypD
MKLVDEYRNPVLVRQLLDEIKRITTRPWVIMEICGGQTHALVRNGLPDLLPPEIELVHGPGCPVCVTPIDLIDNAIALSRWPEVILASFGDMLRVRGSADDLLLARSQGADVRVVYSPLEALLIARQNPNRKVVFFAIGFETTSPHTAFAVMQAAREKLDNFLLLVAHVLVPPAIEALASASDNRINGYLLAGHVCTVTGWKSYVSLATGFRTPMAVTGFEPTDLLQGILSVVKQLEAGTCRVENSYARIVADDGNPTAKQAVETAYRVCDRKWRGLGVIPKSGLALRDEYSNFDASRVFDIKATPGKESDVCKAGEVLRGILKPHQCPVFATQCTPFTPLGAPMVSAEGACAAYYAYNRQVVPTVATHKKQL